eukprot:5694379-Alexandrium_andersonii.AAC.1
MRTQLPHPHRAAAPDLQCTLNSSPHVPVPHQPPWLSSAIAPDELREPVNNCGVVNPACQARTMVQASEQSNGFRPRC